MPYEIRFASRPNRARGLASLFASFILCAASGFAWAEPMPAPAQPCAAIDMALPPAFAAWKIRTDVVSATRAGDLAQTISPGAAARVRLHPVTEVTFPVSPAERPASGSNGGLLKLVVPRAGIWRIALSSGAWIDMVQDRHAISSIAHEHGPACSTIRKIVAFQLEPGPYVFQLSRSPEAEIDVLVIGGR
jgi:hypothetical protein